MSSYISKAWNGAKYYAQTSYYMALMYGKLRAALQDWWSTEFDAHEVADGLFLGDMASAYNLEELQRLGITHIVTAVLGVGPRFPKRFVYHNVPVRDVESENIKQYLPETTAFIDGAIKSGGKVLVHCVWGVSRSATIVAGYVMSQDSTASVEDVIVKLRERRKCVNPNPAFRAQLTEYSEERN